MRRKYYEIFKKNTYYRKDEDLRKWINIKKEPIERKLK